MIWGWARMCRSAASTSQSANTLSLARNAKHAVKRGFSCAAFSTDYDEFFHEQRFLPMRGTFGRLIP